MEIAFAHRTFSWGSEARGKAHVHVVIVGLAHRDHESDEKRLFSYPDIKGDPVESRHSALTAYLFDAKGVANRHLVVKEEGRPINGARKLAIGSQIIDDGHFTFNPAERSRFLKAEPKAAPFMRKLVGATEHINGDMRWVLTLHDAPPDILAASAEIKARISAVRNFRLASKRKSTLAAAAYPQSFALLNAPKVAFLVLPRVSSERRDYVPFGWQEPPAIPTDAVIILPEATLFDFAILTSRAHMAWLGHMGGRLKSDYRYSIGLVYNTFPWPDASPAQRARIEALAQAVLDARAEFPTSNLAALYDPDTMPPVLRKAHAALDSAVDRLYRAAPFTSDRDRVEHLFGRYEALVNPLERIGAAKNKRVARKASQAE
ncbi:type IIL restriction-modification enzyme MmeI [Sphingorhabdus sp.]|uniref:type IIL restriction-modification enzyme MmeI n=1 Tax=Sphingorhabdus sp. TaxID=1902408 RepID=UPI0032B83DC6